MNRELFVITLRPERNVAGLRALRLALKVLLRNHGLRCLAVRIALDDATVVEQSLQQGVADDPDVNAHEP